MEAEQETRAVAHDQLRRVACGSEVWGARSPRGMGWVTPEVMLAESSRHAQTCVHTSGTRTKRIPHLPAGVPTGRPPPSCRTHIFSLILTQAHQAFYTLTHRHTLCAHTKDTPLCTHKARLALPTNSHSDIPQSHHREGRAGHSPPRDLSPVSNPQSTGLWQRYLEIS